MARLSAFETTHPGHQTRRENLETKQRLDLPRREVPIVPGDALVAHTEGRKWLHVKNISENRAFMDVKRKK